MAVGTLGPGTGYQAPAYRPEKDQEWFHVLYGHVPGYQLEYIYRPRTVLDNPSKLEPEHIRHLTDLIKYLEAAAGTESAFSIGNLSSTDTRHRPGHGGLALVCSLRVEGASDQAGRQRPVFVHSALTVDQPIEAPTLAAMTLSFIQRVQEQGPRWYVSYCTAGLLGAEEQIGQYLRDFGTPGSLATGRPWPPAWRREGPLPFRRLYIACPRGASLDQDIATCAGRIGALLYHSDIRWSSISNGYEAQHDESAELLVRFVGKQARPRQDEPRTCTRELAGLLDLDEAKLAALFCLAGDAPRSEAGRQVSSPVPMAPVRAASATVVDGAESTPVTTVQDQQDFPPGEEATLAITPAGSTSSTPPASSAPASPTPAPSPGAAVAATAGKPAAVSEETRLIPRAGGDLGAPAPPAGGETTVAPSSSLATKAMDPVKRPSDAVTRPALSTGETRLRDHSGPARTEREDPTKILSEQELLGPARAPADLSLIISTPDPGEGADEPTQQGRGTLQFSLSRLALLASTLLLIGGLCGILIMKGFSYVHVPEIVGKRHDLGSGPKARPDGASGTPQPAISASPDLQETRAPEPVQDGAPPQPKQDPDKPGTPLQKAGPDKPKMPLQKAGPDKPKTPLQKTGPDKPKTPLQKTGPDKPSAKLEREQREREWAALLARAKPERERAGRAFDKGAQQVARADKAESQARADKDVLDDLYANTPEARDASDALKDLLHDSREASRLQDEIRRQVQLANKSRDFEAIRNAANEAERLANQVANLAEQVQGSAAVIATKLNRAKKKTPDSAQE